MPVINKSITKGIQAPLRVETKKYKILAVDSRETYFFYFKYVLAGI
jgi:hypothetical protein